MRVQNIAQISYNTDYNRVYKFDKNFPVLSGGKNVEKDMLSSEYNKAVLAANIPFMGQNPDNMTDEEYITKAYSKMGREDMLGIPVYKQRALDLSTITMFNNGRLQRFYKGEDILDILWNPKPDMERYIEGSRQLAALKDDDIPFFSGKDGVDILSDPNLDVADFIKRVQTFLEAKKTSPLKEMVFKPIDVANIVRQGIEDKVLYEVPKTVAKDRIKEYKGADYIEAAEFLEFASIKGGEDIDNLPLDKKIELMQILLKRAHKAFDAKEASKDFAVIPKNVEEFCNTTDRLQQGIKTDVEYFDLEIDIKPRKLPFSLYSDEDYKKLSDEDKSVINNAFLFQNCSPAALPYVLARYGMSTGKVDKICRLLEQQNFSYSNNNPDGIKYAAFRLKDSNMLELAKIFNRHNDKKKYDALLSSNIQSYINEIRKHDFILPQTSREDILKHSHKKHINGQVFDVAYSSDIGDFYSFAKALNPWWSSNEQNYKANIKMFEITAMPQNDAVTPVAYISGDKCAMPEECGFLLNVNPTNIHIAAGWDIWSPAGMNIHDVVKNYYFEGGRARNLACGAPKDLREFVSKKIMNHGNIRQEEYTDLTAKAIEHFWDRVPSMKDIKAFNPKLANAIQDFLQYDENSENKQQFLLRSKYQNEALISAPNITAVFAKNLSKLPDEFLEFAKKNNLPIVVLEDAKCFEDEFRKENSAEVMKRELL